MRRKSSAISKRKAQTKPTSGPRRELKAGKRTRRITIEIPAVLLDYFKAEAKRFGMTPRKLIATILETHRFAGRDQQHMTLAIAQSTGQFKTGRYER